MKKEGYIVLKSIPFMKKCQTHEKSSKKINKREGLRGGWEGKEKYYKKGNILKKEPID